MTTGDLVLRDLRGRVLLLTINRAEKRNALNAAVRAALLQALDEAATDREVGAIVITGAGGKAFVAGADIGEFAERTVVEQGRVMQARSALEAIERLPKPVIAAISGYCLGGGLELAMTCDIRIASTEASFGQPEINLGIIPGGGGTQRLPRLIGLGAALKMVLTGEPIPAAEALRLGLVEEVLPPDEVLPRAMQLAERMASRPAVALAAAKEATRAALATTLAEGLRVERGLYLLAFGSKDKSEGVQAFLAKRAPQFTGE
ncbi:MAG: enoyl-CoA hydratase-related protein [Gemmatimonadaceae bacterium]